MAVEAMAVVAEAVVAAVVAEAATPLLQKLFMRREAIPQNSIGFRRNGSPKTHSVKFGRREVTA
jgi:hypothetical protein